MHGQLCQRRGVPTQKPGSIPISHHALVIAVLTCVFPWGKDAHGGADVHPHPAAPATVADLVDRALATAVALESNGIYGAGVLIDPPHGTILTSLHVVEDMQRPQATTHDGRTAVAHVVATDKKLDLAVLSAPELAMDLPPPPLGDSSLLRPGEEVFSIGSPRKLAFTVSRGIVSYVGREMDGERYLQLDMSINDGNSGGPVWTLHGEVVGVMSFILRRAQGLAFALPVAYAVEAFRPLMPAERSGASMGNTAEPTAPAGPHS